VTFGGLERNTAYYVGEGHVRFAATIDDAMKRLLLDPQTSGGLLVGVPPEHAAAWDRARDAHGVQAWKVGEATAGHGVTVV
jgi:selenide,water dikinase